MTAKKLEIHAEPGKNSIFTRRVVDAPRTLVFDMFSKPEHLMRWMGPKEMTFVACEVDLRVGGGFRFVHRTPDGQEFVFRGTYREIVRPERMVHNAVFEMMPEHESTETLVLRENDGKTTIETTTIYPTVEGRDGHLSNARMEIGMTDGYARLDELLAGLQRQ